MTLKEVKRAGKKETSAFKFTASQHARADRQDAQEEKRKKALAKERQREENKRKRDTKTERDRTVKQRMLDEGRITIEDTWGKVTSSQPRLNRFFMQRSQPPLKASRLCNNTASDYSTDEKIESHDENVSEQPTETQDSITTEPHSLQKPLSCQSPRDKPPASLPEVSKNSMPRSPNLTSNTRESPASHWSQPSTLNERQASQTSTPLFQHQHRGKPHQLRDDACKENDAVHLEDVKEDIGQHPRLSQEQCHLDIGYDTEEDFTDEIDDETLLILCSTQKPRNSPSQCGATLKTEPILFNNSRQMSCTGAGTAVTPCQSVGNQHAASDLARPSESFSAIFNEIDDGEFLAIANKVEANLAPASSCSPGSAPSADQTVACKRQEQVDIRVPTNVSISCANKDTTGATRRSISEKRHSRSFPRLSDRPLTTTMPPPTKKKKRRILPWDLRVDDFATPGPSTQAVMLELVEQAEADLHSRRHKA